MSQIYIYVYIKKYFLFQVWIISEILPLRDPAIMTNKTTERFVSVKKLFATEDSFAPNANAAIRDNRYFN